MHTSWRNLQFLLQTWSQPAGSTDRPHHKNSVPKAPDLAGSAATASSQQQEGLGVTGLGLVAPEAKINPVELGLGCLLSCGPLESSALLMM